jgi:hypothetical protein
MCPGDGWTIPNCRISPGPCLAGAFDTAVRCLVAGDAAAAARRAGADPTGAATAIAGAAVTGGRLNDRGGVAQRVNAGRAALLGLRAGRERQRPKRQHRSTQCQCKLSHAIFLFVLIEKHLLKSGER